jgi:hypothetical protein
MLGGSMSKEWTPEEDAELRRRFLIGWTLRNLAQPRPADEIVERLQHLGLLVLLPTGYHKVAEHVWSPAPYHLPRDIAVQEIERIENLL